MNEHTVASFDADLKELAGMIGEMGSRASLSLKQATKALIEQDIDVAQQVIAADRTIDALQHNIEEKAILTIARRQPMSIDLREIVSAMRIANDLERVGDLAKNVAKRVIAIGNQSSSLKITSGLGTLAAGVSDQLSLVMKAYSTRDDECALRVWKSDGAIDALHTSLFRELLTYMMEDPRSIGFCAHLLFCAKNLERVGDHATNIAETAHYVITGEMLAVERPKADSSSAIDPDLRISKP